LAEAIKVAVADVGMRNRAEALGKKLRSENGVQRAIETFDAAVERRV
jgi:hypothetical protein